MKVLHTLDSLNRGGAETLVLDLCRNAKNFGIEMTFVATGGGDLESDFQNAGSEYIRLQRKLPLDFGLIIKLRKVIKDGNIEIVHAYQPVEMLHIYLATIGLKTVKTVLSYQGGGLFLSKKNCVTARFLSPRMDANISCSKGLYSWIREEVGVDTSKNFHLAYNAVDSKRLKAKGKSVRDELGIKENQPILGMVANFLNTNTKDQKTICHALPKVFEKFQEAHFIFAGDIKENAEDYFEECVNICRQNGISERVHFLGKRTDIPEILDSLDLFVFSTLHEGLPVALTEAMFAKVPIISTDIGPLLEATNNGKCAEIFEAKNVRQLSEKMLKLLENAEKRKYLSDKAFLFATENFSMEAHFGRLKEIYSKLVNVENTHLNEDSVFGQK